MLLKAVRIISDAAGGVPDCWAVLIVVLPGSKIAILWIGFIVYMGLTLTTVVQRMLHVHRTLLRERTRHE